MAALRKISRYTLIGIALLSMVLLFQNDQQVYLKFLFWKKEISLYFFTGALLLSGFLMGAIFTWLSLRAEGAHSNSSTPESAEMPDKLE